MFFCSIIRVNAGLCGCSCVTENIHGARFVRFFFFFKYHLIMKWKSKLVLAADGDRHKKWKYLCNIYSSEALYDKKKQNNLICASDAVTYAVFTELKCEHSSIVSCTYCVIWELCSCHFFPPYFCKFAFALLIQRLPYLYICTVRWPVIVWGGCRRHVAIIIRKVSNSRRDCALWEGVSILIM